MSISKDFIFSAVSPKKSNLYTISRLYPIVVEKMTPEIRSAKLNELPNQFALKEIIEFYYYTSIHDIAIENKSEMLHKLFIEWAERNPLSRSEEVTLLNLEESYRDLGDDEKAAQILRARKYYFPFQDYK